MCSTSLPRAARRVRSRTRSAIASRGPPLCRQRIGTRAPHAGAHAPARRADAGRGARFGAPVGDHRIVAASVPDLAGRRPSPGKTARGWCSRCATSGRCRSRRNARHPGIPPILRGARARERLAYRRADTVVSLLSAAREHMTARGLAPKSSTSSQGAPGHAPSRRGGIDPATPGLDAQCRAEGRRWSAMPDPFGAPYAMISFLDCATRWPVAALPASAAKGSTFLFVGDGIEREPLERGLEQRCRGRAPPSCRGQRDARSRGRLVGECDAGISSARICRSSATASR